MTDTKSAEYRKMRDERRELVQLAIEEAVGKTGQVPSAEYICRELRVNHNTVYRDWDYLHSRGLVPARPGPLPRRNPGRNLGTEGGGTLLEAEGLLRAVLAEITGASPEYLGMSREFWITHLEVVSRLAEDAIALAMGATVDNLIGQIRKEERG